MKKTLLLAGVACIFSYNANAMNISSDLKPYIGLDYVYSKADFKGEASRLEKSNLLKDNYNSGVINAGIKLGKVNQKNIFNILLTIAAALLSALTSVNVIFILIGAMMIGIIYSLFSQKKKSAEETK